MRRSLPLFLLIAAGVLAATLTTACSPYQQQPEAQPAPEAVGATDPLPPAEELLAASAKEMAGVASARFRLQSAGAVDNLTVRAAEGVITRAGDAEGTATVEQSGMATDISFVVADRTLHYKALIGGWQASSLEGAVYDPSGILDAQRGVPNLLGTATGAETAGREQIGGVAVYRVAAAGVDPATLERLVPGLGHGVAAQFWVGAERPVLHRAVFTAPGGATTVTVVFSDFDRSVTVDAP